MAIEKPVYEDDDSIDEQIRSAAAGRAANRTEPTVTADSDENYGTEGRRTSMASMPSKKPAMVTKEELAASGMSLRDYLNKQQGLTRRGEASTKAPTRPGQEESGSGYRMEGANKAAPKRSGVDLTSPMSALRSLSSGTKRGGGSYAKGGSVSSASKRADGIATKGKTRGTMIMCGGGMTKR